MNEEKCLLSFKKCAESAIIRLSAFEKLSKLWTMAKTIIYNYRHEI